jgi:hypothetical protein
MQNVDAMLKEYGKIWAAGTILTSEMSVENIEQWLNKNARSEWKILSIGATFMRGNSSFKILFKNKDDKETFLNSFPG